jgi:hypothetical protein
VLKLEYPFTEILLRIVTLIAPNGSKLVALRSLFVYLKNDKEIILQELINGGLLNGY